MSSNILCVSAVCTEQTKTIVTARNFQMIVDEPVFFGGEDCAPSPVEYLLASIAGCVAAIAKTLAKQMGIVFYKMEIQVEGDIDSHKFFNGESNERAGFTEIRINTFVESDLSQGRLDAWRDQVMARCPVIDNLCTPTAVKMQVQKFT